MDLNFIRAEIEHMRTQVVRQRKEILQRAGIPTAAAKALLEHAPQHRPKLCAERDRLKAELPGPSKGKVLRSSLVSGYPKYFWDESNPSRWLKALAEIRAMAPRQGFCYHHVQALIVAVDQYAEAATGNREYFLDKPYSIGGSRRSGDVP